MTSVCTSGIATIINVFETETASHLLYYCAINKVFILKIHIDLDIIQFICILESQVVECSMGSFYTQRF